MAVRTPFDRSYGPFDHYFDCFDRSYGPFDHYCGTFDCCMDWFTLDSFDCPYGPFDHYFDCFDRSCGPFGRSYGPFDRYGATIAQAAAEVEAARLKFE